MYRKQILLAFTLLLIFFTHGFSYRESLRSSSSKTNVPQIDNRVDESKRSYNRYRNDKNEPILSYQTNISPLIDRFFWEFSFNITKLEIKEFVFIDDYVLSRLDWKFDNKFDLTVGMTYRLSKKVNFKGILTCSLPLKNGTMDDYDWAETDAATNYTQSGILTHQSHHINKLDYDFKFSGKVIEYSHLHSIVYLGVKNKFNIFDWLSISLKNLYSPVAYIKAVDNHILRDLVFREYLFMGTYLYNEISIKVNFSKYYSLTFNLNHTYIPTFEGKSYVEIDGVTYINGSAGGTSVNEFSFGLGFAFKI